jgi:hypothetical protein
MTDTNGKLAEVEAKNAGNPNTAILGISPNIL